MINAVGVIWSASTERCSIRMSRTLSGMVGNAIYTPCP
jgi:hypothetical protein